MADFDYNQEVPKGSKTLPIIGLLLTFAWLALVGVYLSAKGVDMMAISLSDMGGFFGGVFAPLAFLWLVLGYFQQGEELRNSGKALWLQGRELQASVEQQRELVAVTRDQLQFESDVLKQQRDEIVRNAQPILSVVATGSVGAQVGTRLYSFSLLNHGKSCTGVVVRVLGASHTAHVIEKGGKLDFSAELPTGSVEPFNLTVSYLDEQLIRREASFRVIKKGANFDIAPGQLSPS
jgi:hypothetical protein